MNKLRRFQIFFIVVLLAVLAFFCRDGASHKRVHEAAQPQSQELSNSVLRYLTIESNTAIEFKRLFPDYSHTNLPPGWEVVCSDDGLFAIKGGPYGQVYATESLVSTGWVEAVGLAWHANEFYKQRRGEAITVTDAERAAVKNVIRDWKECK